MTKLPEIRTSSKKSNFVLQKPIRVQVQSRDDKEKSRKYMRIKPFIIDQLNLIKQLREDPSGEFYYMIYAVDRSSEYFSPYALKIVDYKDVSKTYMTINVSGVTQYSPDEMTFTPIELWEKEYTYYLKLIKIKIFSTFRLWKSFYIWRKSITCRKFTEARRYIQENLFVSNLILGKALVKLKSMCVIFLDFSLVDISVIEKLSLFDFVELQLTKLEYVRRKLDEFRELVSDTTYYACIATLLQFGYTVDNSNIEQTTYGKFGHYGTVKKPEDVKMNYRERTRKKEKCHRLSRFIHLIDYMQINMMHGVLLNTYKEFIGVLEAHTAFIPENTILDNNVIDTILEERRLISHVIQYPYFTVDLLISMKTGIVIDPSQNVFYFVIQTLQTMWEENLSAIKPLLSDPFFQHFTRPIIIRKSGDQSHENSLEILKIIKEDPIIWGLKNKLTDVLETNFHAVNRYCQRFNEIQEFYNEDMKFDESIIRDNKQCDLFRNWCIRYKREIDTIDRVVEHQPLGIFLVQLERFKNAALNAPRSKKKVIEAVMLRICKRKVDALLTETMETINYLELDPVSTDDYVAYIKFIDKAQQKVDFMEEELNYVKELYDIMEEFDIVVPTKDMVNYQDINMQFTILRLAIEKRLEKKQKLITMFETQIQKDITMLSDKLSEIDDEVRQSWLLDVESNPDIYLDTQKS